MKYRKCQAWLRAIVLQIAPNVLTEPFNDLMKAFDSLRGSPDISVTTVNGDIVFKINDSG